MLLTFGQTCVGAKLRHTSKFIQILCSQDLQSKSWNLKPPIGFAILKVQSNCG